MLSLNIKSSNYMCIDIATDSVIHKHLVKKIDNLDKVVDWRNDGHIHNLVTKSKQDKTKRHDWVTTKHDLTMLDSFHISLGKPPKRIPAINIPGIPEGTEVDIKTEKDLDMYQKSVNGDIPYLDIVSLIGDITLAPICISEKDGKKSAWIPINPLWIENIFNVNAYLDLYEFDSFDHRCDECPVKHLHVSIANLTGKPRDSIARPEDCIIDTITA